MAKKSEKLRHILALSGGKDSAALAVYLRDKVPDLEYVFLDTGHELPETYEFLQRMRAILQIQIKILKPERSFEDWLKYKNYYLPSPQKRWCTQELKIRPYEKYIGSATVISYLGIRADEERDGYISSKPNIIPRYPFIEDGLVYSDIQELLELSGLGFPAYYKWRSRSGCYFCFFQQKSEWINLYEHHRELFLRAVAFEKVDSKNQKRFTWCQDESLTDLLQRKEIISQTDNQLKSNIKGSCKKTRKLVDMFQQDIPTCVICE